MAVSRTNEHLLCVICSNVFNDPCTLTCGHSFCRVCLTKHTKNHPSAEKSRTLPCAVCRQATKVPDYSKPVDEWAWQIKPSLLLQELLDGRTRENQEMDTCCACQGVGETTQAKFWCKKCSLRLCDRCATMHTKAPFTKSHDVLLISEAVKKKIEKHNQEKKQSKEKERKHIPDSTDYYRADRKTYRQATRDHNRVNMPMVLGQSLDQEYHSGRNLYRSFNEPIYVAGYTPGMPFPTLIELPYPRVIPGQVQPTIPVQSPLVYNRDGKHSEKHYLSASKLYSRDQQAEEPEYSGIPFEVYRGKGKREFISTDVAYEPGLVEQASISEVPSSKVSTDSSDESIYCTIDSS